METKLISWADKKLAVDALKRGEVVLFPTETVYGIACIASSKSASDLLRAAKGRPDQKPITVMCCNLTQVAMLSEITCASATLMKAFMPGEVTLLLPSRKGIAPWIDLGTGVVGVRVPNAPEVLSLIDQIGEPLLVSSANLSGEKPALTGAEAMKTFGGRVPLIIDGPCVSDVPSTIVLCGEELGLVREGNVPFAAMQEVYAHAKTTIALGSDHGGFEYRLAIIEHLEKRGFGILDCGCKDKSSVDYPDYGRQVGEAVASGKADLGIVVCTSGEGISIAANKVPGIRCGIGYDDIATGKTREHNDANVISFGQKYMALEDVLRRVDIFLCEKFSPEEKHHRRVGKLEE